MSVAETIKRGALKGALLLALLFILAFLMILLYLRLMAGAHDRNLAELEYRNGQIIIYHAGYNTGFVEFPTRLYSFSVRRIHGAEAEPVWILEELEEESEPSVANPKGKCTDLDKKVAMSRVVYGIVPPCYAEVKPAATLKKNERYSLGISHSTRKSGGVFFKLVDCPEDPSKTCLETNSPYRKDRDEKRRSRRVR